MWIWIRIMGDLLDPDLYRGRRGSRIRIRITTNVNSHHWLIQPFIPPGTLHTDSSKVK